MRHWPRSKYEKVIHRVIAREPMRIGQKRYQVDRMNGWYEIEFREVGTKRRRRFNLDELVRLAAGKKPSRVAAQTQTGQNASPEIQGMTASSRQGRTRRLGSRRSLLLDPRRYIALV